MNRKLLLLLVGIAVLLSSVGYSWGAAAIPSVVGTYNVTGPLNVSVNLNLKVLKKTVPFASLSASVANVGLIGETFTYGPIVTTTARAVSGPFKDKTGFLVGTWTQNLDLKHNPTAAMKIDLDLSDIIETLAGIGITATVTAKSFACTVTPKQVISGTYSYTAALVGEGGALVGTLKVWGNGTGTVKPASAQEQYGAVEPGSPESLKYLWSQLRDAMARYRSYKKP